MPFNYLDLGEIEISKLDLNLYKVSNKELPGDIYYIPNFVNEKCETFLISKIKSSPIPSWTQLRYRRLQNWGGLPMPKGMIACDLPEWLAGLCDNVSDLGIFGENKANHVLINEYLPGQGIMPHTDGPLYFPCVSNITLGTHTVLKFYDPINTNESSTLEDRYTGCLVLQRRALLLMSSEAYTSCLHGIDIGVTSDLIDDTTVNLEQAKVQIGDTLQRGIRYSLTIRHVNKVIKNSGIFKSLMRK